MSVLWDIIFVQFLHTKCLGVNALGGLSASFIINILRACCLIKCALALIPSGTGYGGIIIGPEFYSRVCLLGEYACQPSLFMWRVDICGNNLGWHSCDCGYVSEGVVMRLALMCAFCVD